MFVSSIFIHKNKKIIQNGRKGAEHWFRKKLLLKASLHVLIRSCFIYKNVNNKYFVEKFMYN